MKQIRHIILCAVLCGIAPDAWAQTLSIGECRQMAIEHNKNIQKSQWQVKQMEYDTEAYRSNFYPRINLMATDIYSTATGNLNIAGGHLPIYSYNEAAGQYVPSVTPNADGSYTLNQYADFPDQSMKLKVNNIFTGGIMLTQPVYMGGKITTAYEMAKIVQEMAQMNASLTEDDIILKTDEENSLNVSVVKHIQRIRVDHTVRIQARRIVIGNICSHIRLNSSAYHQPFFGSIQ